MSVVIKYSKIKKGSKNYVSIIDDETKYKAIKSNVKTLQTLGKMKSSQTLINQYSTLFNLFKNTYDVDDLQKNNITWINKYYDSLYDVVKENYLQKNNINPNTASSYLNSLAKLLLHVNKSRFREYTRNIFILSKKYKIKNDDVIKDKTIESFERLKDITTQSIELYNKNKTSYTKNIDMLIMVLNIYLIPMRLNILDLEVRRNDNNILINTKNRRVKQNFIYLNGSKVLIVINTDKVSDKSAFKNKSLIIDLDDEDIRYKDVQITNNKFVKKIIKDSLKRFNRYYLLTPIDRYSEPMDQSTYTSRLKRLTKNPNMSQNVIRRTFISHYYPIVSKNIQKVIAKYMRHDTKTARAEYLQNKDNVKNNDKDKVEVIRVDCPYTPKKSVQDAKIKYYQNNKKAIQRRKIISYLNSKDNAKPQKRTIDNYDLQQDDKGKWY